jgi:hypothetical protein
MRFSLWQTGGCVPKDPSYVYPVLHEDISRSEFVEAKTDPTQYQLMNLMELMEYNRLDILNLSDICEGNYDNFKLYLKVFQTFKNQLHSIFSQERAKELSELMDEETPIILAWGTNSTIKELAEKALQTTNTFKRYGVAYSNLPYFRHPKPLLIKNRIEWLAEIKQQLNSVVIV